MILKKINLLNFRNYEKLCTTFSKGINIIYGENGQGKTNLLESIYVLGLTKSHRSFIDNNLKKNGKNYCAIQGLIDKEGIITKNEIILDEASKILKINNNTVKKVSDYISNMNIIIFSPDDLEIVKSSPQIRRKYLNLELSQLYSNYLLLVQEYNKLLKIRNECLKKMNMKIKCDKTYFDIITSYLIDKQINIYKIRKKYIDRINEHCGKIYEDITGLSEFKITYKINIPNIDLNDEQIKNKIIEKYNQKLENDIKNCYTSIGPHKDDIEFYLKENNLKNYGSQGQQRIAILSFKLAEIEIFKKYKHDTPILLLDDIFSELDITKKNNLLKYISKNVQTIITTTDLNNINNKLIKKSKLFKIENGSLIKIKEVKL